jgi:hypothetical protein
MEQKWITDRLPECEVEVLICYKYKNRKESHITTAIYEDGTMLENDSIWDWEDIDGEYDENEDCYIIPQGWWEYRHFNPDDVYNNLVDAEVLGWMPLPEKI